MPISVRPVESRRDLKTFIHLPAKIHKHHENWIPPLYSDEWIYFNPEKNKAFSHSDTILLLAYRDNKPAGRIMGIINHLYNKEKGENNARFNFLEAWDEPEVSEALIGAVTDWARERGAEKLVGPLAFSDKDPQGFLVEGFDAPMVIASHCNFEYIVGHMEAMGFTKEIDLVVYKVPVPDETPEVYSKIAARAARNNANVSLKEFSSRRELKKYVRPIFSLVNETFRDIYGFTPFTLGEMDDFANRYLPIMNPDFIKVILNEKGETIAFIIAMPDISQGIKKSGGYIYPIGFIPILRASRKTKQLNLLLGAIHPDYQNKGLDTIMGSAMLEAARAAGLEYMDSHLEMETNRKVRAEMEYMGGEVYKRYRIFQRKI